MVRNMRNKIMFPSTGFFFLAGTVLAISCSYFLEEDNPPNPLPEDAVYIRNVSDQETKPKSTSGS